VEVDSTGDFPIIMGDIATAVFRSRKRPITWVGKPTSRDLRLIFSFSQFST
jgi:hypothetical protein